MRRVGPRSPGIVLPMLVRRCAPIASPEEDERRRPGVIGTIVDTYA
jgi:hypothetical protein